MNHLKSARMSNMANSRNARVHQLVEPSKSIQNEQKKSCDISFPLTEPNASHHNVFEYAPGSCSNDQQKEFADQSANSSMRNVASSEVDLDDSRSSANPSEHVVDPNQDYNFNEPCYHEGFKVKAKEFVIELLRNVTVMQKKALEKEKAIDALLTQN
ncbi:unnamed protein product [Moneuplotes crassus]|uniref:Uncharacterized protein n=1 Tax=Euplotes crassus TaxID=5936 RepID=A0AAD2D859_EUPCR|nr:unnamed protein product [Moneuplotes crassus]